MGKIVVDGSVLNYLSVGEDELVEPLGYAITCPHCNHAHRVHTAKAKRNARSTLQTYSCPETGKTYLCGIDGKSIMERK